MHARPVAMAIVFGALVFLVLGVASASGGSATLEEAHVTFGGVYEIHRSPDGDLVISDYGGQKIWLVDPATDGYTTYAVGRAIDAKGDGQGNIWWTDYASSFGVLSTTAETKATWTLVDRNLHGIALDADGHVWFSEWFGSASNVYRFDPATTDLCTYILPLYGTWSYYLVDESGYLWLLNWDSEHVLRLDTASLDLDRWDVGAISSLEQGLAVDGAGRLWWADRAASALSRLDPHTGTGELTRYPLPKGSKPEWLGVSGDLVWYTESLSRTVGVLDPTAASGSVSSPSPSSGTAARSCAVLGPGTESPVTTEAGTVAWAASGLAPIFDVDGWTVYQLAAPAKPFGLAVSGDHPWVTDQSRRKLLRISPPQVETPDIDVEKSTNGEDADTAPGPLIPIGKPVVWTYRVENTGNVELTGVSLVDDNGSPGFPSDDYSCTIGSLGAGAIDDTTCSQTGTAMAGQYTNTATVRASYGVVEVSDSDTSHYRGTWSVFLPLVLKDF
jgi:streptogramin lyase